MSKQQRPEHCIPKCIKYFYLQQLNTDIITLCKKRQNKKKKLGDMQNSERNTSVISVFYSKQIDTIPT